MQKKDLYTLPTKGIFNARRLQRRLKKKKPLRISKRLYKSSDLQR
jgi:hypothetical protein